MRLSAWNSIIALGAATWLASSVSTAAIAQAQEAARTIANNDSVFIDGNAFKIVPGSAKGDVSALVQKLGARELGPAAIVFRSGDKLYIADRVPLPITGSQHPRALLRAECERTHLRSDCERDVYDPSLEPRQAYALNDAEIERQRPYGLRDSEIERQRPRGLTDVDIERQRPRGLHDSDIERQRAYGLTDADIERQRPRGLRESDIGRQRAYVNDPDYAYFKLKKAFEESWNSADDKN